MRLSVSANPEKETHSRAEIQASLTKRPCNKCDNNWRPVLQAQHLLAPAVRAPCTPPRLASGLISLETYPLHHDRLVV
eukprot:6190541-Pleurochrysis_carterae.AAC.1